MSKNEPKDAWTKLEDERQVTPDVELIKIANPRGEARARAAHAELLRRAKLDTAKRSNSLEDLVESQESVASFTQRKLRELEELSCRP